MTNVEVIGVKETIRELRQFDPELRKQFNRDAKKVAEPILNEAKSRYPDKYLSGMARIWSQRGRKLFPYSQRDAQRGVVFKIDTGRRATSILTIIQKNPAAAIESYLSDLRELAFNMLENGQPVPGYKLVQSIEQEMLDNQQ